MHNRPEQIRPDGLSRRRGGSALGQGAETPYRGQAVRHRRASQAEFAPRTAKRLSALLAYGLFSLLPFSAVATELVYTPVNPSFGGNALNGSTLLNAAQAQNNTKDPAVTIAKQSTQQSPLQQFNDMLERSVLNRLASAAIGGIVNESGKLVEGTVSTGNFAIEIIDLGGGVLQVTTTDKVTGASTSFQVGQQ